jgi:hypothetical protein
MKRVCVALVVLLACATSLFAQQADSVSGVAAGRETGARASVSFAGPIIGGLIGGSVAGFGVTAFSWNPGALEGAMVGVGVTVFALSARTKLSSDDHARINAQLEGRSPGYINGYKEGYRSKLAQRRIKTALWLGIGGAVLSAVLTAAAVSGT